MKVYIYYLKIDWFNHIDDETDIMDSYPGIINDVFEVHNGIEYYMYGYTNIKRVKKMFEEQRDLSKFYKKVIHMTELEYDELYNSYMDLQLDFCSVGTKDKINNVYKTSYVTIVTTQHEYMYLDDYKEETFETAFSDIGDLLQGDEIVYSLVTNCLNHEIDCALKDVLIFEDVMPHIFPYEEYPLNVVIDELGLFLNLFGNTFKHIKEGET